MQRFQWYSSLAIFLSKRDKGEHDSREKYSSMNNSLNIENFYTKEFENRVNPKLW